MSSKNDVKKAHAAAAAKASRARLAALKNKASPAPTALQSVRWVKLMQACADAQAAAESTPSLAAWRGAVGAAAALAAEVGADDDAHDDDRCGDSSCGSCAPSGAPKWSFVPPNYERPSPEAPSADETARYRAFAKKATAKALLGRGEEELRAGDRAAAAATLAELLASAADKTWGAAWEMRGEAFLRMCGGERDEGARLLAELHFRKAADAGDDVGDELAALEARNDADAVTAYRDGAAHATDALCLDAGVSAGGFSLKESLAFAARSAADGDALMREGLWRAAHAKFAAALHGVGGLGGPLVAKFAVACNLNAAACLLRAPDDGASRAVAAAVAARCGAALDIDPKNATAHLRRGAARERAGDFELAAADYRAARRLVGDDRVPAVDAKLDHVAFLARTR